MSKKISDSEQSSVCQQEFQQTISSKFSSDTDFLSDSESEEDEETMDQFMIRMQKMREDIVRQSTEHVPEKYQHLFADVSTPTKVKAGESHKKQKKEKRKVKLRVLRNDIPSSSSESGRYQMYKEA